MEEKLYTSAELQSLFHLSRSGLDGWVRQGKIPAPVRIGHRRLWRQSDIESLIADPARSPHPPKLEEYVTISDFLTATGMNRQTFDLYTAYGHIPAPGIIPEDKKGWKLVDIEATLNKFRKEQDVG